MRPLNTNNEIQSFHPSTDIGKSNEDDFIPIHRRVLPNPNKTVGTPLRQFSPLPEKIVETTLLAVSPDKTTISETTVADDSGSSFQPDDEEEITSSMSTDSGQSIIIKPVDKIVFPNSSNAKDVEEKNSLTENCQNENEPSFGERLKKNLNFFSNVDRSKRKSLSNKRKWDRKDVCIFCEVAVTNFTRHLLRNHSEELEVAKYLSLKKGTKERKILADQLRKKGNFFNNVGGVDILKPVRRPNENIDSPISNDYLPCKYCYGYLKKKYLKRHVRTCKLKGNDSRPQCRNIQAEAQNLLITFTSEDDALVQTVFPRMAPDDISFTVKSDPLIRAFGTRYLKCHKEKHLVTVVSNKMREIGRLLIEMRKIEKHCKTLQDCLKPKYFDAIIKSTKIVSGYDSETDTYKAPSLVLKIGTSVKQCCDIAEYLLLKESSLLRKTEDVDKTIREIRTVEKLIEKQWSYELSTNASKEIYQKKFNKPALLPLTSDLKVFRDHLLSVQNESMSTLKSNPKDTNSYKNLQESVLAQLILLNRKRAGEVQRMFLNTYINNSWERPQEEIELSLSPVEKALTKIFKRIVIRGKRGRGVPVLFTPKIQKSISVLIALRDQFGISKNEYLFATPNTNNSCLRASAVLRKLAVSSGAKFPKTITSTKLRKQVATVAQLLNLSEGDVEQLATFMGHSRDVHKTFYRLPENVFQVAKVSKFLLMMEKGDADQYRGKNLDEIDINVNSLLSSDESDNESDISYLDEAVEENPKPETRENVCTQSGSTEDIQTFTPIPSQGLETEKQKISKKNQKENQLNKKRKKNESSPEHPKKKAFTRIVWTSDQKTATADHFHKHILLKQPPKKAECEDFIQKNEELMRGIYLFFLNLS